VQDRASDLQNKAQQVASQGTEWASHRAAEVRSKAEEITGTSTATQAAQPVVMQEASSAPSENLTAETAAGDIRIGPEDHAT
jgi:hypothetical protein